MLILVISFKIKKECKFPLFSILYLHSFSLLIEISNKNGNGKYRGNSIQV